jgi:hypothetical protein
MELAGSQLSRYGAIANPVAVPLNAKAFFVAGANTVDFSNLQQEFPVDKDGEVRVFTTIQAAVNATRASRGDVIYVMPGHTESVTAAAGLVINKAGVSIIGLGRGASRPTITFSGVVGADMDIDAANVTIENIVFALTGVDALAAPIDVNAADFTLRGCRVITASASAQATLAILTDANANRLTVEDSTFLGTADAGTATVIRIVGGDGHVIRRNIFQGAYTTTLGAIENNTTACTNTFVTDNNINNLTASSTKAMVFAAGSTGMISRNAMQILSGTAPITGSGMSWVGQNYYAAALATAGTLI